MRVSDQKRDTDVAHRIKRVIDAASVIFLLLPSENWCIFWTRSFLVSFNIDVQSKHANIKVDIKFHHGRILRSIHSELWCRTLHFSCDL